MRAAPADVDQRRRACGPMVSVFAPDTPWRPGPRIRNDQLVRYAGYAEPGRVLGDRRYVDFTTAVCRLGWRPPTGRTRVRQAAAGGADRRTRGSRCSRCRATSCARCRWSTRSCRGSRRSGLRWHAVPVISNCGCASAASPTRRRRTTACTSARRSARTCSPTTPRTGSRGVIAERLGLDTTSERTLWRDRAVVELNRAVVHSFDAAGVTIKHSVDGFLPATGGGSPAGVHHLGGRAAALRPEWHLAGSRACSSACPDRPALRPVLSVCCATRWWTSTPTGRLGYVGPAAGAPASDEPVRSLPGILLPGMINTHAHSPMTVLRGMGGDLPLMRWLQEIIWPAEAKLTPAGHRGGHAARLGGDAAQRHHDQRRAVLPARPRGACRARRPARRMLLGPAIVDTPGYELARAAGRGQRPHRRRRRCGRTTGSRSATARTRRTRCRRRR